MWCKLGDQSLLVTQMVLDNCLLLFYCPLCVACYKEQTECLEAMIFF